MVYSHCFRNLDRDSDRDRADIIQKPITLAMSVARTGHLKATEISLKVHYLKVSGPEKWVHNSFFPVPVQVSVLVQVQCEKFFLKPYNPFFLVQVPVTVPVPETAGLNTPL